MFGIIIFVIAHELYMTYNDAYNVWIIDFVH